MPVLRRASKNFKTARSRKETCGPTGPIIHCICAGSCPGFNLGVAFMQGLCACKFWGQISRRSASIWTPCVGGGNIYHAGRSGFAKPAISEGAAKLASEHSAERHFGRTAWGDAGVQQPLLPANCFPRRSSTTKAADASVASTTPQRTSCFILRRCGRYPRSSTGGGLISAAAKLARCQLQAGDVDANSYAWRVASSAARRRKFFA